MVFIYVLKLEENKFYIGKTNNPSFRLQDHTNGNGSTWTTKYNPIKLMELVPNCDAFDEDKYTLKYMELVGIDNVRGGSFCQINLSDENKSTIQKMLSGTTDKCYNWGKEYRPRWGRKGGMIGWVWGGNCKPRGGAGRGRRAGGTQT